jgi:hypothetical protein
MLSEYFSPYLDDMPVYTATYFRRGDPSFEVILKTNNISNHSGLGLAVPRIVVSRKRGEGNMCANNGDLKLCNIYRETFVPTIFSVQASKPLTFLIKTVY